MKKYPQRSKDVAFRAIAGETIVVIPDEGLARVLNPTASRIWDLMDGSCDVEAIVQVIEEEFDLGPADAASDVQAFINEMVDKKMAVMRDEPPG